MNFILLLKFNLYITAIDLGATRVPLEQLLKDSDYVILACPLSKETKHLINEAALKTMKKTSVLVNIGRGGKLYIIIFIYI